MLDSTTRAAGGILAGLAVLVCVAGIAGAAWLFIERFDQGSGVLTTSLAAAGILVAISAVNRVLIVVDDWLDRLHAGTDAIEPELDPSLGSKQMDDDRAR